MQRALVQPGLLGTSASWTQSVRGIARIPHWEYHLRFDQVEGRKVPAKDVLDRFKRLNNGMWIRTQTASHKQRYLMTSDRLERSLDYMTCNKNESEILDKLMTPYWLRPKYYLDDPFQRYQGRHGLRTPRVDAGGRLRREREKVLLDDTTADRFFSR